MLDGKVDGPDQHNNKMDTADCSKLSSLRMTFSNLITSLILDPLLSAEIRQAFLRLFSQLADLL